jgi:type IV secretory pathway TraG/TraD family ATPase VirD4
MNATKILWGQILVVCTIVLATLWLATQWTAWRLGFQPQLGQPWFDLAGIPVYLPPIFFLWWFHFGAYAPNIFLEGAAIASSGGFAAIAIAIGMSVWRAREAKAFRPTARPDGRQGTRFVRRGSSARTVSCSAASLANICVTTGRSTCCASPRPVPGRA